MREPIDRDRVLDLWEMGTDVQEIRRLVTRKDGSMFQATLINRVAWQARAAGDKRAVRRKGGRRSRKARNENERQP